MRSIITFVILLISISSGNAQNSIFDKLKAAPVGGGFEMEDYWVWGSSVIKGEDDKYHMFVSR